MTFLEELWKNPWETIDQPILEDIHQGRRSFLKYTAMAAIKIVTLNWCWTTETIKNKSFYLDPLWIYRFEETLEAWTYEIEIRPYSENWDPAMEIELWNDFYYMEYYQVDNTDWWWTEKFNFTIEENKKIIIWIKNVWTESSNFSLRILKEQD